MHLKDWWTAVKRRQDIEVVDIAEQALKDLEIDNGK